MVEDNHKAPTELDTFLPNDGLKDGILTTKYKNKVVSRDVENVHKDGKSFDPFLERQVPNPTTDCDTLTHLLKASLGTGILAMPVAFASAGLLNGIFATVLVAFVCTHCAYILVKCAHVLYYKTRKSEMSFAEVAQTAFSTGPTWARRFAVPSRYLILISLFVTYFGTCSVYTVIVAKNFKQVIDYHWFRGVQNHSGIENGSYSMNNTQLYSNMTANPNLTAFHSENIGNAGIDERILILSLLIPLILLSWVPDLKQLAPISMVANLFMGLGLGITFYYLVKDLNGIDSNITPFFASPAKFPNFFSITIFAMEAIGVVMPLENNMKTPKHFVGICGVLNKGMSGVTMIYILLGFLGYARYGDDTCDSITLNLPKDEIAAQAVKVLIGLAVYCTFGLQFCVCLEIGWNGIKEYFQKKSLLANYALRTILVVTAVLLAAAVPTIGPFIGLIGAFCFSILGLLIPVFIETVTYWDIGFGRFHWVAAKNIIICVIGLLALVFGSRSALHDIYNLFIGQQSSKAHCG